jgi:uncharacterized protein
MAEARMPWDELYQYSTEHGLLAKKLYVVMTEPTNGLGPVLENLDEHVKYQTRLEREGVMFAAGPLSEDEQEWRGDGVFMYRAGSKEEAVKYAEQDPMHASGARRFTVRAWIMNEGTVSMRMFFSSGAKPQLI